MCNIGFPVHFQTCKKCKILFVNFNFVLRTLEVNNFIVIFHSNSSMVNQLLGLSVQFRHI